MRFNWNKLKMAVSHGDSTCSLTCSTLQTEFSLLEEEFFGNRLEEIEAITKLMMMIAVRAHQRMVRP